MTGLSFFSLRVQPGSASWKALPEEARASWSLYCDLEKSQWLTNAELVERQLNDVRSLLKHCTEHVPFIKEQLRTAGIEPADIRDRETFCEAFRKIPVSSRATWQEHAESLRARRLPAGTSPAGTSITSGSTGVPLEVLQTNVVRQWWWACNLRDLRWGNIDPLGTLAAIRSRRGGMTADDLRNLQNGLSWPVWFPAIDSIIASGPAYGLDIVQESHKQLDWLVRISPNYLLSYPSNLQSLALLAQERGIVLPELRAIQTVSETLTDEMKQSIEAAFGVPVQNSYSCAEAGYLASPCPAGHGLHVHAEHVLLEVLDENDQPCGPGETGRVVLTALHNYLSPFVRYAIGDYATMGPAQCPCGRGLPLLTRVEGKRRPLFQLPNGKSKNCDGLVYSLRLIGGMRERQMIQRSRNHMIIRVVPDRHWTNDHARQIRQAVTEFFESPMQVEVQLLDRMDRAPRGKLVDAICEVAPPATAPTTPLATSLDVATPTRTVLISAEMVNGPTEARSLLLLARAIASHGHCPVLAVHDAALFTDQSFETIAPPIPRVTRPELAASYADVLTAAGFGSVETLLPQVLAWRNVLDEVRPALILCADSPSLLLAAFGSIPTIVIGDGFAVPPAHSLTFPALIPNRAPFVSEAQLLRIVQQVQRQMGQPAPEALPTLFSASPCFVTTLAELDPYIGERRAQVVGPWELLPAASPAPAISRLLVDLRSDAPEIEKLLAAISQLKVRTTVYLQGASPEQRLRWQNAGMEMLEKAPLLHEVIPHVSAIVHHGATTASQYALAIGRPQLVFPSQMDQLLTSQLLHGHGVAHYILGAQPLEVYLDELRLILSPDLRRRAIDAAFDIHGEGRAGSLPRILARCLSMLRDIKPQTRVFQREEENALV